jgi:RNA polymerase sigma-70 factor, ECF subfamily
MERSGPAHRFTGKVLRAVPRSIPVVSRPSGGPREIPDELADGDLARYHVATVNDDARPSRATAGKSLLDHADALYHLARYLTVNQGDAEDLVQETFIRALKAGPEAGEGHTKAWLFKILRNLFLDLRRRQKKHGVVESLDENPTIQESWLRGDAELDLLRRALAHEIEAAVSALPEDGRTVILLDFEGFTESEIADIMECPLGTVKSRLMRARLNLRRQLRSYAK